VYATSEGTAPDVQAFQIHSDGSLSAVTISATGFLPSSPPEINPSGSRVYIGSSDGTIYGYSIASDGALSPLPHSPYTGLASPQVPWDLEMNPDGQQLYAVYNDNTLTNDGEIATFDVASDGALTIRSGTTDSGGTEPSQGSMTISPDPGPVAAVSATGAPVGEASSFSAASSHASLSNYEALTYDWNFGDGTKATDAGATPTHTYSKPGTYTATVAAVDGAGCSTALVWTGMNSFCASDPSAVATVKVVVPGPTISRVTQTHKRWRTGGKLARISGAHRAKKKPPIGTTFTFTLNEPASLALVFTHQVSGRKVHRKCVAVTHRNRHDKTCKRTVTLGTLKLTGRTGKDKVSFDGRVTRHVKLKPGTYTVTITATVDGTKSAARHIKFAIVGS
jgi:PKD repeat protein